MVIITATAIRMPATNSSVWPGLSMSLTKTIIPRNVRPTRRKPNIMIKIIANPLVNLLNNLGILILNRTNNEIRIIDSARINVIIDIIKSMVGNEVISKDSLPIRNPI